MTVEYKAGKGGTAWGQPIPRLYSAGELGSLWGTIYQDQGGGDINLIYR